MSKKQKYFICSRSQINHESDKHEIIFFSLEDLFHVDKVSDNFLLGEIRNHSKNTEKAKF